ARRQEGCTVRNGADVETNNGSGGVRASHRHLLNAGRPYSGHAHARVRRSLRVNYAVSRCARSQHVCARRLDGGALGEGPARLVYDAWCVGIGVIVMRTPWTGVGTALVTPFTRSGDLDEAALRRLARRQIEAGVHFLVPCGTTGENPTLTAKERVRVVEILLEETKGQVPVLAGAGGYNTKEVIELAAEMKSAGAQGLLSVTPYYNKPTQKGMYQHSRTMAESTPLPIVLYNVPGRTGVKIELSTLLRLAAIPNIVGVKEASGNVSDMCDICRAVPPEFIVLSGDDALTLPLMAIGGRGIISVASN